jgi:hypothetical protein
MKCLKYVLVFILALAQSSSAQLASVAIWRTGVAPYTGEKDTADAYGLYASHYQDRWLVQGRRGLDGKSVVGIFAGRNLIDDSYHSNLFVFLSGGMLMGEAQKGPALELVVHKMTINETLTAEFRSEYAWGTFGTQNLARNSFLGFLKLGDGAFVGMSGEALYRPRSGATRFDRVDAGPVVRILYKEVFLQGWHYWDLNDLKIQRLMFSIGLNQ